MVLKLSFIMIGPSECFASSSYTSHHCYTEEKNVTLNEYLYVDLDKLFLKEQHAFPLKVRPTNMQAHIDKLSIKIKRRVVNGQTFSFHSLLFFQVS